jgi:cystathionine beta-synthase
MKGKKMRSYKNILETIGHTPLVRLNRIPQGTQAEVYAKLEFMNPGGSIKDRIGLRMIEEAEKAGRLRPGGTIVEATAGNTGVGLALVAAVKGYRCVFVMPDKMSKEKINLLRAYGAEVVITPSSVAPDSPESYNGVADRLAKETPNSFRPNQFENSENPQTHYLTTGPEIWEDTQGKVDILVAGMGTGGTISGTAKYLKEKNSRITVVGADPVGSILSGDSPKAYKVEGIGEDFIPKTFNRQLVDEMVRVNDKESFNMARRLAREEGLLAGGSAGTALAAALKYIQRLEEPKLVVVVLPDTGRNYIDKIFSDKWMQENGFWEGRVTLPVSVGEILGRKAGLPALISISPKDKLSKAVTLFQDFNISQMPVIDGFKTVGSLNEASIMQLLHDGADFHRLEVGEAMGKPLPTLDQEKDFSEAYRVLLSGATGVVVEKKGMPIGLITRADLVTYWMAQKKEL